VRDGSKRRLSRLDSAADLIATSVSSGWPTTTPSARAVNATQRASCANGATWSTCKTWRTPWASTGHSPRPSWPKPFSAAKSQPGPPERLDRRRVGRVAVVCSLPVSWTPNNASTALVCTGRRCRS
jgi:hypothetical protein